MLTKHRQKPVVRADDPAYMWLWTRLSEQPVVRAADPALFVAVDEAVRAEQPAETGCERSLHSLVCCCGLGCSSIRQKPAVRAAVTVNVYLRL